MLALSDYLVQNPQLTENDTSKKINRMIDSKWVFADKSKNYSETIVDFQEFFGELPPYLEVWVKQILQPAAKAVSWVKIESEESGRLICGNTGLRQTLYSLSHFTNYIKELGVTSVSAMTHQNVINMFETILHVSSEDANAKTRVYPGIRAYLSMLRTVKLYLAIKQAFVFERLTDGFSHLINEADILDGLVNRVAPNIDPTFNYPRWKMGNKLDGLPAYQSMAFLMACLNTIRSDKTLLLNAVWKWNIHSTKKPFLEQSLNIALKEGTLFTTYRERLQKVRRNDFDRLFPSFLGFSSLDEIPENFKSLKLNRDFGNSEYEATHLNKALVPLAMFVIAIITGARRNELESINVDDIYKSEDGSWRFKSKINKTNQGLSTVRYIAGIAAEMVDFIKEVREARKIPFSGALFANTKKPGEVGVNWADRNRANGHDVIDKFVNIQLEDDLKIRDFNIHSVRHAWAEFALRRFEGSSVPELIRQHFRHHYGSYMTKRYTEGKVMEEDGRNLRAEYIEELVGRFVDGDLSIYGPVGDFIAKQVQNYTFISQDEIKEIADIFEGHIEPHEYGFCMVRPETVSLAQCYNKQTQLAETDQACWEKCGGCVNRASLPEHREDIQRRGISIKFSIQQFRDLNLIPLANAYEAHLKLCESALKDFGKESNNV